MSLFAEEYSASVHSPSIARLFNLIFFILWFKRHDDIQSTPPSPVSGMLTQRRWGGRWGIRQWLFSCGFRLQRVRRQLQIFIQKAYLTIVTQCFQNKISIMTNFSVFQNPEVFKVGAPLYACLLNANFCSSTRKNQECCICATGNIYTFTVFFSY